MGFAAPPTSTGRTRILRMDGKVFDHNGGATRPVDHGKARDPRFRSEFCPLAFPCPAQGACGLRDGRKRTREQALQVPLVESNHMVQQLAAAAPHPTLGDTILPGTFERGPYGFYLQASNGCRDLGPVFCAPVMDEKSGSRLERERLPQLLDDPTACRVLRDVEMQDTPAIVADDKEAVEDAEADLGHGEEVHGRNRFPVIPKKGAPALGWLGIPWNSLHAAGDASLGYLEAQHEQFAVNARRAPGRVLRHHTEDQLPNFRRQFFPADLFSRLRDPTPVQSNSAMPANDRLRIDQHQRLLPSTPETAGEYPEDSVNRSHPG